MTKNTLIIFAIVTLASSFIFSACGSVSNTSNGTSAATSGATEVPKPSIMDSAGDALLVDTLALLPPCTSATLGRVAFVQATNEFESCNGTSCSVIDVQGKAALVKVVAEAAGPNCAQGGNLIKTGLDSNGDKILTDDEVQANSYACYSASESTVAGVWSYHIDDYSATNVPDVASNHSGYVSSLGDIQIIQFADKSALVTTSGFLFQEVMPSTTPATFYSFDFSHSFFLPASNLPQTIYKKINFYDDLTKYKITLGANPTFQAITDSKNNIDSDTLISFSLTKIW